MYPSSTSCCGTALWSDCAAKESWGPAETSSTARASITPAAFCSRRSSVCRRRCSALLRRVAVPGAMGGGGRGTGWGFHAEVDLGEEACEAFADGPVQQPLVGVA